MKKIAPLLAALLLCSCTQNPPPPADGRLSVVTTLFPTYDFARAIGGEKADVKLLLTPGRESHSYEPSTGDVVGINNSDIFIYTSEYMEPWAEPLLEGMDAPPLTVDASEGIKLAEEQEHEHENDHDRDGHGGFDPHIWTSPRLCLNIAENILAAYIEADPENADYYHANASALVDELTRLDDEFRSLTAGAAQRKLYHGGRFSMNYFAREYGLEFEAAYDSCSTDTEPSVRTICSMIDEMREEKTPVVFYEELSNNSVALLIADETGAEPLLLHSCHNLTNEELRGGATYVGLMEQNYENLKLALEGGAKK